jgi:hypothetical protein
MCWTRSTSARLVSRVSNPSHGADDVPRKQAEQKAAPQPQQPAPAESHPPSDVDALGELMLVQGTMHRQFLRVILRRLATDVPGFQSELLLAELQLILDSLAAGRDKSALHAFAQKEWQRLADMALEAIASTRTNRDKH